MKRWGTVCCAVALGLAACKEADPQEAYVVLADDHPERPVGWALVEKTKVEVPELEITVTSGDAVEKGTGSQSRSVQVVRQVLAPDRRRVTVQRDQHVEQYRVVGVAQDAKFNKGVLVGKYILLSLVDGKWQGAFESGKQPNQAEAREIARHAKDLERSQQLYGFIRRKEGSSWNAVENDPLTGIKSSFEFSLEAVEEFRGQECAVLTSVGTMTTTRVENGARIETKLEGETKIYRSLKHFEDLQREFSGVMRMTMIPPAGTKIEIVGPCKILSEVEITTPESDEDSDGAN